LPFPLFGLQPRDGRLTEQELGKSRKFTACKALHSSQSSLVPMSGTTPRRGGSSKGRETASRDTETKGHSRHNSKPLAIGNSRLELMRTAVIRGVYLSTIKCIVPMRKGW
jgi:hypothetical protein